jgi:hypothetical protein
METLDGYEELVVARRTGQAKQSPLEIRSSELPPFHLSLQTSLVDLLTHMPFSACCIYAFQSGGSAKQRLKLSGGGLGRVLLCERIYWAEYYAATTILSTAKSPGSMSLTDQE